MWRSEMPRPVMSSSAISDSSDFAFTSKSVVYYSDSLSPFLLIGYAPVSPTTNADYYSSAVLSCTNGTYGLLSRASMAPVGRGSFSSAKSGVSSPPSMYMLAERAVEGWWPVEREMDWGRD